MRTDTSGEKKVFPTSRTAGSSCGALSEQSHDVGAGVGMNSLGSPGRHWASGQQGAGTTANTAPRRAARMDRRPPGQNHSKRHQPNQPARRSDPDGGAFYRRGSPTCFLTKWDSKDFAEPKPAPGCCSESQQLPATRRADETVGPRKLTHPVAAAKFGHSLLTPPLSNITGL